MPLGGLAQSTSLPHGAGSSTGVRCGLSREAEAAQSGGMNDIPDSRALGSYGERLACRYLTEHGHRILDRNWRCARGELDIVSDDGGCLVVCEVKTRSSHAFGEPFEAVTWRKRQRLQRLAGLWIDAHPELARTTCGIRLDVVSILRPASGPARITHLVGAS